MLSRIKEKLAKASASPAPAPAAPAAPPVEHMPVSKNTTKRDLIVGGAFVGAIALLLVVAGYVITRIASENAYQKKWEDYRDCGWA